TDFTFRPSPNATAVRYYQTKNTAIVDAEGHAVDQSAVRPGVGATIYYTTSGDRMIVQKIVVNESVGSRQFSEQSSDHLTWCNRLLPQHLAELPTDLRRDLLHQR